MNWFRWASWFGWVGGFQWGWVGRLVCCVWQVCGSAWVGFDGRVGGLAGSGGV